jgi:hypothetical protein
MDVIRVTSKLYKSRVLKKKADKKSSAFSCVEIVQSSERLTSHVLFSKGRSKNGKPYRLELSLSCSLPDNPQNLSLKSVSTNNDPLSLDFENPPQWKLGDKSNKVTETLEVPILVTPVTPTKIEGRFHLLNLEFTIPSGLISAPSAGEFAVREVRGHVNLHYLLAKLRVPVTIHFSDGEVLDACIQRTFQAYSLSLSSFSVLFCSVLFCSVLFCSVLFCSVLFLTLLFL